MDRYSRREFLKTSSAAVAAAAISNGAFSGCASSPAVKLPPIDYAKPLLLTHCSVVDVAAGRVLPDRTITIEMGLIRSIEPYRPGDDRDHTSINLGGRHVIPGLIDAHCHLTLQSCGNFKTMLALKYVEQIKRNGMMQVNAGVTTVRDMGSFPKLMNSLLKDYAGGSLTGPRVVHCGAFVNVDGGHPDIRPTDLSVFAPITETFTGRIYAYYKNRAELMDSLRLNIENGASFIKLTMDDRSLICGKGKIPAYSDEDLKDIFDFAESKGLPVAVHSVMLFGLKRALNYPVHSMEHVTTDAAVSDAEIKTMVRKKVSIVPTFVMGQTYAFRERYETLPAEYSTPYVLKEIALRDEYLAAGPPAGYDPELHKLNLESIGWLKDPGCEQMAKQGKFMTDAEIGFGTLVHGLDNIRRMKNAGVRIGCGTDAGVPLDYHGTVGREMEMMARAGFRNDEVLKYATINNAGILGLSDAIGAIKKGMRADLAVLGGNPLANMSAVRSPLLVIMGGAVRYSAEELKPGEKRDGGGSYAI